MTEQGVKAVFSALSEALELKYVIAVYNSNRSKTIIDIAETFNGEILTFKKLGNKGVKDLFRKLIRGFELNAKTDLNIEEFFDFNVRYLSADRRNVAFSSYINSRTIKYHDNTIKITNLPEIVFVINELSELKIFEVCSSNDFIALNLPNISHNGSVCLGGKESRKFSDINDTMNEFYNLFWNGNFTSHNDSTKNDWSKGSYRYKRRVGTDHYTLKNII